MSQTGTKDSRTDVPLTHLGNRWAGTFILGWSYQLGLKVYLVPGAKNTGTKAKFQSGSKVVSLLVCVCMSAPVHFLFGGDAAIYTCLPCHFKSQRLLCLCANFDRSSRYMYFWNLIGFRRFFDIYISLLCSPWLSRHLYLSAARFILWAFFPRVFIYAWTLCSHFPHHELNCVFRIGPHVYRLLTTEKQSLTGLLAYYIYTPILKFYWASFDDFFIYIIINRLLSTAAWASLLLTLRPLTDIQWRRRRSNSSNSSPSPATNPAERRTYTPKLKLPSSATAMQG